MRSLVIVGYLRGDDVVHETPLDQGGVGPQGGRGLTGPLGEHGAQVGHGRPALCAVQVAGMIEATR